MSKTLDIIVASYVETSLRDQQIPKNISPQDVAEVMQQSLKDTIYKEVKGEIFEDAMAEASRAAEKKRILTRIRDYKILLISGIFIAFLIGMSVNQFTNILDRLIGCSNGWSAVWGVVFIGLCLLIYRELVDSEILRLKKVE